MIYDDIYEKIKERCGWIADIYVYPGEREQEALALETVKALRGEREIRVYDGKPVFDGFDCID
jgi:butyrate kinase